MKNNLKSIDITFSDLIYSVNIPKQNEKKTVLNCVSGAFKSGELSAIMGPSGAGKSTLLNILTGFTKTGVKGQVQLGTADSSRKPAKTSKLCSYIQQEDNLFPWFTVEESMVMAAQLKIPKHRFKFEKLDKINIDFDLRHPQFLNYYSIHNNLRTEDDIDDVLISLNLMHTKKTKCCNLSGGQRKRFSIALEMIDNPPLLLLDEPTTGLDSSASSDCIKLLQNLARDGRTIVCTIHQPSASIYEMFDHVYVLAEGNCIYQGSTSNTVSYLSSVGLHCPKYHNSADYLLEVANCEYGNFTKALTIAAKDDHWRSHGVNQIINNNNWDCDMELSNYKYSYCKELNTVDSALSSKTRTTTNEWTKLNILIKRNLVQYFRDWTVTHLKLLCHILCAIVVGLLFSDSGINAIKAVSNIGSLLIGVVYLWYTTVMPAVLRFPSEIKVLKKEIFNNWYSLRTYYISLLITSSPIQFMFATVYSTIAYLMTNQPYEFERLLRFVLIHVLIAMIAEGYGLFFGAVFNPINGTFIGAIISCYMLVFAGFLALFNHMPTVLLYISYSSALRFGLEGAVLSVLAFNRSDMMCPDEELFCAYKSPKFLLKELGMYENNYNFDVINLLIQLVIIKTIAYYTLKRRLNM